ncbi:tetratricopeptide repeat protein [Pirellulaceae bacterium SH501]
MAKQPKKEQEAIVQELSGMSQRAGELMEKSFCESAFLLFGELRHRAKSESNLMYYVIATFFQMNLAQRRLQFEMVRERAIELIAIFENEEQARKIEPEMELNEYEGLKYTMCACAYEVLAEATGEIEGFNSEGMQECLTGGMDVCRRIGKLSCIGCFREYACDIHKAADDYELARYHCNQVLKQDGDFSDRGDRRWLAILKLATLDMFDGQHDSARSRLDKAWELAGLSTVNDPLGAKTSVAMELHTLDTLEGLAMDDRVKQAFTQLPPRDECPEYDLDIDCLTALQHAMSGSWSDAELLLTPWIRSLKQTNATSKWLETGIRLVAVKRLKGDLESAKRIAAPLEVAATKSNDWHSVRRLSQILDPQCEITALGTVVKKNRMPLPSPSLPQSTIKPSENEADGASPETENSDKESEKVPPGYYAISSNTPLFKWLEDFAKRLQAARDQAPEEMDIDAFRNELLLSQNRDWSHPEDIGRALYFMIYLISPGSDYREIWTWANRLVAGFQETGYLISLLARLGMAINAAERFEQFSNLDFSNLAEELPPAVIESERLDQLVRKSLQLDSNSVNNNFRAGEIFEYIDNAGEAERCYARAFKLDRSREDAALALARIYMNSERNSDAHYVLDLCIREGGSSAELFFEAAMRAHALSMHELQVSYLKTLLERFPPVPWCYYYLAIGLLEIKKPTEALETIEHEIKEFEGVGVHIDAIQAEAHAILGNFDKARQCIQNGLSKSLVSSDALTQGGISSAMDRLWRAAKLIPTATDLQKRVEERLLQCGMAPEDYFAERRSHEKPRDLQLFHVSVLQPLDDEWEEFPGCLPEQADWTGYVAHWGILADDAEQAAALALEAQRQCYSIEPEIMDVTPDEEPLHDRPGVAFQGYRASADEILDDDEEGDGDNDMDLDDDESPF